MGFKVKTINTIAPGISSPYEINQALIAFYKERYLYYMKIGIGNDTMFGTTVTKLLISCTANRLDQLIKGKKTKSNTCDIKECLWKFRIKSKVEDGKYNSNRSFIGTITSRFKINDLETSQQHGVENYFLYADGSPHESPRYIDKVTTAYNSDIMKETLLHNN